MFKSLRYSESATLSASISIGASKYKDYYEYLDEDEDLAEERRRLYRIRHGCPDKRKGTAGFYACKLLW